MLWRGCVRACASISSNTLRLCANSQPKFISHAFAAKTSSICMCRNEVLVVIHLLYYCVGVPAMRAWAQLSPHPLSRHSLVGVSQRAVVKGTLPFGGWNARLGRGGPLREGRCRSCWPGWHGRLRTPCSSSASAVAPSSAGLKIHQT